MIKSIVTFMVLVLTFQFALGQAPPAPTGVTVSPRCAAEYITWSASPGATSYTVYRSNSPGGTFVPVKSPTSPAAFDLVYDSSLEYSTTYYYYVTATNSSGTSAPSSIASAQTLPQIFSITVTPQGTWNKLNWPSTPGAAMVFRSTSAQGPFMPIHVFVYFAIPPTPNPTTYTDKTAVPGTTYFYKIFGNNNAGWIGTSPTGSAVGAFSVPTQIVPNPPNGVLPDPMTFPMRMGNLAPNDTPTSSTGGPASTINVELVHGVATVDTGTDIIAPNANGPDLAFSRLYRTAMAAGNVSSPGFSPGWTHNWDYRIITGGAQSGGGAYASLLAEDYHPSYEELQQWIEEDSIAGWGLPLQFVDPAGATELLYPVLNGNNLPTGQFTVPSGAPYLATGTVDLNQGIWTSITLTGNGLSKDVFTVPSNDSCMRLTSKMFANGSQVWLNYSSGKLTQVYNGAGTSIDLTYTGGLLSKSTDYATGAFRNYTYVSGQLNSVSRLNGGGAEWNYTYATIGGQPYVQSVGTTDPLGNVSSASIGYETVTGRAQTVTDSNANARGYSYALTGGGTVIVGPPNNPLDQNSATCDAIGRINSVTDRGGATTNFGYGTYDPCIVTSVNPPLGNPSTLTNLDSHNNLTRYTSPYGNYVTTVWEYPAEAPLGRIQSTQETGNGGQIMSPTTYSYYGSNDPNGPLGFLKTITYPLGESISYTYTAMGNVATVSGIETASFDYIHTNNSGGTGPELLGRPYKITDEKLKDTYVHYDSKLEVDSVTGPLGNVISSTSNAYGQPTSITLPGSKSLSIAYGVNGKAPSSVVLHTSTGQKTLAQFSYNSESSPVATTDANGITSSQVLDAKFDIKSVTNGNQKPMHQFTPNNVNRSVGYQVGTGSRSASFSTQFDSIGNPTSFTQTGVSGLTSGNVTYQPGDPDKVIGTSTSNNNATCYQFNTNFTYDAFGRVATATSGGANPNYEFTHTYTYDDEDHVLSDSVTGSLTTTSANSKIVFTYNADGTTNTMHVRKNDTPLGVKYFYGYDPKHRNTLIQAYFVNGAGNVGSLLAWASYKYDDLDRVTIVRTKNSVTLYTYNSEGQITSLKNLTPDGAPYDTSHSSEIVVDPENGGLHSNLCSFTNIGYDDDGNRTQMDFDLVTWDALNGHTDYKQGSAAWGYDASDRLVAESWNGGGSGYFGPNVFIAHGIDNADNVSQLRSIAVNNDTDSDQMMNSGAPYNTLSFDSLGNRLTWKVDPNTNPTERSAPSGWDPAGQLTRLVDKNSVGYLDKYGEVNETNAYDSMGHRIIHRIENIDDVTRSYNESFVYVGDEVVMRQVPGDGQQASSTIPVIGSDLPGAQIHHTRAVYYINGPTGKVVEFDTDNAGFGTSKSMNYDPQGNCVWTTTGSYDANLQWVFYDAYGRPVWNNAQVLEDNVLGIGLAFLQPYQYKGQYGYHSEAHSGLVYCHYRFYDPGSGRWLSRDPMGLEGGVNAYDYCGGNPIMFVDPQGTDFEIGGFMFTWDGTRDGLKTGGAAILHSFSFNHYTNKWATTQPGYDGAVICANVSREALSQACGEAVWARGGELLIKGAALAKNSKAGMAIGQGARRLGAKVFVTAKLKYVASKIARQGVELTPMQKRAIEKYPRLLQAFKGERLDFAVREALKNDKLLSMFGVSMTPRGKFGPDFLMEGSSLWWDVTTRTQWQKHLTKYSSKFGDGVLILNKVK